MSERTVEEIALNMVHHFRWMDRKNRVDLMNAIAAALRTEREARVRAEAERDDLAEACVRLTNATKVLTEASSAEVARLREEMRP